MLYSVHALLKTTRRLAFKNVAYPVWDGVLVYYAIENTERTRAQSKHSGRSAVPLRAPPGHHSGTEGLGQLTSTANSFLDIVASCACGYVYYCSVVAARVRVLVSLERCSPRTHTCDDRFS